MTTYNREALGHTLATGADRQLPTEQQCEVTGTTATEKLNALRKAAFKARDDAEISESQRVDWLLNHSKFDRGRIEPSELFYISTWICNGEPGNKNGGGALFSVTGSTPRDCIDKFIRGNIQRADC